MGKINIAELLKDCPSGMELDSPVWDNIEFDKIDGDIIVIFRKYGGFRVHLSRYGAMSDNDGKCIIFPKGKTTWEGFVTPGKFKDGDILAAESVWGTHIFIYNHTRGEYGGYGYYAILTSRGTFDINSFCSGGTYRLATSEEKEKLFQAIKDNGYCWNAETKTLGNLPNFKVGDRIKKKGNTRLITIQDVRDNYYIITIPDYFDNCYITDKLSFSNQGDYELFPNKFDINTLKPFDKVLVRLDNANQWYATLFSHIDEKQESFCRRYVTVSGKSYTQMIPYEGNKHLCGTKDNCEDYYKTW